MITKEQALELTYGDVIYEIDNFNANGTPVRWRVNGQAKTWKRDLSRFQVPIKHGLYDYSYLDNTTAQYLCLGMIERVCSDCKVSLGWKDALRPNQCDEVSHTLCKECGAKVERQIQEMPA